jgi:hypothetical protein
MSSKIGAKIETLGRLYSRSALEPDQETASLAAWWVARAACVFECLGGRPSLRKALAGQARTYAEELESQQHRPSPAWGLAWLRPAPPPVDASLRNFLASTAEYFEPRDASGTPGLFAELTSELEDWCRLEGRLDALIQLQHRLQSVGSGAEHLLERAAVDPDADAQWQTAARRAEELWHEARSVEERATAAVVVRLSEQLSAISEDEDNWQPFHEWTADWFGQVGARGGIVRDLSADRNELVELARHPSGGRQWLRVEWSRQRPPERTSATVAAKRLAKTAAAPKSASPQPSAPEVVEPTFAALPPPASLDASSDGATTFPIEWHQRCGRPKPSTPQSAVKEIETLRSELVSWLATPSGEDWLNGLIVAAAEGHDDSARLWWAALRSSKWFSVYPVPGAEGALPAWPESVPLPWPGACGVASMQPENEIIEVERYAVSAERARFRLSDGPSADPRLSEAFARLSNEAERSRPDLLAEGGWQAARSLVLHPPAEWSEQSLSPLLAILDRHLKGHATGRPAEVDDAVLAALRDWAGGLGLELLPNPVVLGAGLTRESLNANGCDAVLEYRSIARGEASRVVRWGLSSGGRVLRRGVVGVSLGPAPRELVGLVEAVRSTPQAASLANSVGGLKDATLGGYLEAASVELFQTLFSDQYRPLRESESGREITSRLLAYLQAVLGLVAFTPENVMEHPSDWMNIVAGPRVTSGKVRQVFRPGLKDSDDRLICPAIVSAE